MVAKNVKEVAYIAHFVEPFTRGIKVGTGDKKNGKFFIEAIDDFRAILVVNTFRPNTNVSVVEKLRAIVATYHSRYTLTTNKDQGVNFTQYLYVPELK